MIDRTFSFGTYDSRILKSNVEMLGKHIGKSSLLVCDSNTVQYVADLGYPVVEIDPGEEHKNWDSIDTILKRAVELELGRDACFVGFGGGVVCDMTAFAASVYLRGCSVILAPTTLLSMVDASIGGKTGIDFLGYKNLVGTFYPAESVFICTDTLSSLPEREYRSGLAEVIKHGLLGAADIVEFFESESDAVKSRDSKAIELFISRSLDVKGKIVEQDLRESGVRAHLNLGHTFGHALEAAAGFGAWSHGEAVAWGIDRAMQAGVLAGITDPGYSARVRDLLVFYEYKVGPLPEGIEVDRIIEIMGQDKKKKGGELQFVLQKDLGATVVKSLDKAILRQVLSTR